MKEKKFKVIPTEELAALVTGWLDDKQAMDVKALDVRGLCAITDTLVIATAKGARHAKALADHLLDSLKQENIEYLGMEGYQGGEWVLLDLNDVIVHIFQDEVRAFYNIEGLWAEGKCIDFAALREKKPGGEA